MEITPAEIIRSVYQPYDGIWDEWKSSRDCFLDSKTISVFETYLKTGDLRSSCVKFQIDEKEAERILYTAIIVLHIKLPFFEEWLFKEFFKNSVFWLTNTAIEELPFDDHVRSLLLQLNEPNLTTLFKKYSLSDLYTKWGKENTDEFYLLMKYYQCCHLIKIGYEKQD